MSISLTYLNYEDRIYIIEIEFSSVDLRLLNLFGQVCKNSALLHNSMLYKLLKMHLVNAGATISNVSIQFVTHSLKTHYCQI